MGSKLLHISWLIAAASASFVIGVALSAVVVAVQITSVWWVVLSGLLVGIGFFKNGIVRISVVVVAGLIFGLWRGSVVLQGLHAYTQLYGQTVVISGQVTEDPSTGTAGNLRMRLGDVTIDGSPKNGVVWVSVETPLTIKRSDSVVVQGQITRGFGTIPAAIYRAQIMSVERPDYADVGRDMRDAFATGLRRSIQEPEASLAAGFIVGQKTALPEKLDTNLRLLGLTHIIVASGYNLSILVRYARKWLSWISRFTALAGAGFLVFGFSQITGHSPSMARAAFVTWLSLLVWYYGRKIHPLVLLSFASAVTVVINPSYAWGDLGWLLSFTSFVGVLMLAPVLQTYFWGSKKPWFGRRVFIETLSAQVLTLPIIAFTFGQYSPLSLLANMLIVPLIPIVMGLGFSAGLVGMLSATLGGIVGIPAELILRYMTGVVDYLAGLPAAQSEISFSFGLLITAYAVIVSGLIYLWKKSGHEFRDYNVIE